LNASDTAPIKPKIILDYCGGSNAGTYTSTQAQKVTNQGAVLALGVGPLDPAQANAVVAACTAGGQHNVIFRVMWELNSNYISSTWDYRSGWSAASAINVFQLTAANLRAAMPGCKIVWNPSLTNTAPAGRTSYDTYPGAAACDYVAFDGYDAAGSLAAWETTADAFISLAKNTWKKPWGVGEWGLSNLYGPNAGDDPAYIDAMAARCTVANGCVFQCYFSSSGAGGFKSELSAWPDCLARYLADFPAGGGTWPP
jgi:hypothetical protein